MQIVYTPANIDAVTDPPLRAILERYRVLMDLCIIYVVQPNDTLASLQVARGRSLQDWEFIHDHGGIFEIVLVLGDFGDGHVVIVPDSPAIDAELLTLCRQNATKPDI